MLLTFFWDVPNFTIMMLNNLSVTIIMSLFITVGLLIFWPSPQTRGRNQRPYQNLQILSKLWSSFCLWRTLVWGSQHLVAQACLHFSSFSFIDFPFELTLLLEEFSDITPANLLNELPPILGIQHTLNLFPSYQVPNRPPHRIVFVEQFELNRHVETSLDKDFLCPTLSPCAVSVLLTP